MLENNVGGTVLLKLTRADLSDLLPGDFLARKQLWDVVESLVSTEIKGDISFKLAAWIGNIFKREFIIFKKRF